MKNHNHPTEAHRALFYPALLIGRDLSLVFAIVVCPSRYSRPLRASLQHAALRRMRSLARRALFRAQRRGVSAAHRQPSNRRGASLHRIHGASSQAIRRGPKTHPASGHRQDNVRPVVLGLHQSSSARAELHCSKGRRRNDVRLQYLVLHTVHRYAPSSLRSFTAARAATSCSLKAVSPT